jgi:hypothetical protein
MIHFTQLLPYYYYNKINYMNKINFNLQFKNVLYLISFSLYIIFFFDLLN